MLISMLMLATAVPAPLQGTHKVTIDDHRYRVTITGDTFQVAPKAFRLVHVLDQNERDRMYRAVEQVTKCRTEREWTDPPKLNGKLNCGEKPD